MRGRTRRTAAAGATVFILTGSAIVAGAPGTASAEEIEARCGETVTVKPGDTITTPFGLRTVTEGVTSLVGGLLGGLCEITVHVADTVVSPIPVAGPPVADAVSGAVSTTTNTVKDAVSHALPGTQAPPDVPDSPGHDIQRPPTSQPGGSTGADETSPTPGHEVSVLPGDPPIASLLPFGPTGFAPIRDYRGIPFALTTSWAPSPGLRFGDFYPGYFPESGALAPGEQDDRVQRDPTPNADPLRHAGQAEALASASEDADAPLGPPTLLAALALSVVTAALTRRWVARENR